MTKIVNNYKSSKQIDQSYKLPLDYLIIALKHLQKKLKEFRRSKITKVKTEKEEFLFYKTFQKKEKDLKFLKTF